MTFAYIRATEASVVAALPRPPSLKTFATPLMPPAPEFRVARHIWMNPSPLISTALRGV